MGQDIPAPSQYLQYLLALFDLGESGAELLQEAIQLPLATGRRQNDRVELVLAIGGRAT